MDDIFDMDDMQQRRQAQPPSPLLAPPRLTSQTSDEPLVDDEPEDALPRRSVLARGEPIPHTHRHNHGRQADAGDATAPPTLPPLPATTTGGRASGHHRTVSGGGASRTPALHFNGLLSPSTDSFASTANARPVSAAESQPTSVASSFGAATSTGFGDLEKLPTALSPGASGRPKLASATANNSTRHARQVSYPLRTIRRPRELQAMVTDIVKNRVGAVLQRQMILKSDHFTNSLDRTNDFLIQGAPNFRMVDMNIYGAAQPTIVGISSIMALLDAHPQGASGGAAGRGRVLWFSAREEPTIFLNGKPFVLRESEAPTTNIRRFQGISALRLERVEARLKEDVLREAQRLSGLLLVHDELEQNKVVPSWISPDMVQTPREVFEAFQASGYRVDYLRVPISPEQAPNESYLDEYVTHIQRASLTDALVFNCGMGVGRTTFALCVALLLRQSQQQPGRELLERGAAPELAAATETAATQNRAILRLVYALEKGLKSKMSPRSAIEWALDRGQLIDDLKNAILGNYTVILQLGSMLQKGPEVKRLLDQVVDQCDALVNIREVVLMHRVRFSNTGEQAALDKAFTCLERYFYLYAFAAYVSETSAPRQQPFSEWLARRPEIGRMLEYLRRKGPRLTLFRPVEDLSVLAAGDGTVTAASDALGKRLTLTGAADVRAPPTELEKVVIKARAGVVLGPQTILKVDQWSTEVLEREVIPGAPNFRKIPHMRIYGVAQPTVQGAGLVLQAVEACARDSEVCERVDQAAEAGGEDASAAAVRELVAGVDGCSQVRSSPRASPNGVSTPVVTPVGDSTSTTLEPTKSHVCWINLREEPLIYINSVPYVLRDQYLTLRNIKSYSGIPGARLEMIESRLKDDILAELSKYEGSILLHGETPDGRIVPTWEDVLPENVRTPREMMDALGAGNVALAYHRVPVTAEAAPDYSDFDHFMWLLCAVDLRRTSIVVNCQVGRGRSTVGTVMATLVTHWLNNTRPEVSAEAPRLVRRNYQIINSLIRVIRNGLECKRVVDEVIDQCGSFLNIREEIEDCLSGAELAEGSSGKPVGGSALQTPPSKRGAGTAAPAADDSPKLQAPPGESLAAADGKTSADVSRSVWNGYLGDRSRKRLVRRGLVHLKRYFLLIVFQSYLEQSPCTGLMIESLMSFSKWMRAHGEFQTLLDELDASGIEALMPVQRLEPGDGVALTSEVLDVVNNRCGAVLGPQTILKHDMFPGCQKLTLPERIPSAPNFRAVSLPQVCATMLPQLDGSSGTGLTGQMTELPALPVVCGCAMPAVAGIRTLLQRLDAHPGGSRRVCWTNLREEPVIYVNGKPYVLRLFQDPVHNLEATGITRERVEQMEETMKRDVIEELRRCGGRLLLHDEELAPDGGGFCIVPLWETVAEADVLTTRNVYDIVMREGFHVTYLRLPITDEQAPIPDVFDELLHRVLAELAAETTDLIFNCQMGRGRTTTGMVITCLVQLVLANSEVLCDSKVVEELENSAQMERFVSVVAAAANSGGSQAPSPTTLGAPARAPFEEGDELRNRYLRGEYKLVLQLIGVLGYGKLAKAVTDAAIDACDHLQNLRSAIYDYKLRVEAAAPGSRKHSALNEIGVNYLIRYFYLITFAGYLLEELIFDAGDGPGDSLQRRNSMRSLDSRQSGSSTPASLRRTLERTPFSVWLSERRELQNLLSQEPTFD